MTDHYALFGHPVDHSKSPLIRGWFAESTGAAQRVRRGRTDWCLRRWPGVAPGSEQMDSFRRALGARPNEIKFAETLLLC